MQKLFTAREAAVASYETFQLRAELLKRATKMVNGFESEQVQLRVIDALIKDLPIAAADQPEVTAGDGPEPADPGQSPAA
jgi:hypothetical protein